MSKCGEKTDVYSRITGYFRPTRFWNRGKASELADRVMFKVPDLAAGDERCAEAADSDAGGANGGTDGDRA